MKDRRVFTVVICAITIITAVLLVISMDQPRLIRNHQAKAAAVILNEMNVFPAKSVSQAKLDGVYNFHVLTPASHHIPAEDAVIKTGSRYSPMFIIFTNNPERYVGEIGG
jgi:hypothetical protein